MTGSSIFTLTCGLFHVWAVRQLHRYRASLQEACCTHDLTWLPHVPVGLAHNVNLSAFPAVSNTSDLGHFQGPTVLNAEDKRKVIPGQVCRLVVIFINITFPFGLQDASIQTLS